MGSVFLCREWQKAANGESLMEVVVPIGLLLSDIADRLELSPQEKHVILGGSLIDQINLLLEERISVKPQA